MTRTRVRWGRVGVLVLVTVGVLGAAGRAVGDPPGVVRRNHAEVIHVEQGVSLWSIARVRVGTEGDPRPLIEEIRELNDLESSVLQVGQRLLIPSP